MCQTFRYFNTAWILILDCEYATERENYYLNCAPGIILPPDVNCPLAKISSAALCSCTGKILTHYPSQLALCLLVGILVLIT